MAINIPVLHVDGSLSEYIDKRGVLHKVAGLGGYLVLDGKIVDKFSIHLRDVPHLNHHEDYAIIEGLKWIKEKGYKHIKIKSDSMPSISLFNNHKKALSKIDKFFLLQYLTIEFSFEKVELLYHNRSDNDLSHILSRSYLKELPKDITRLHCDSHKKKVEYEIVADGSYKCDLEINKVLVDNMKKLLFIR